MDKWENENVHKPGNKPSEAALLLFTWFLTGVGRLLVQGHGLPLSLLHPTPPSAPTGCFPLGGEALKVVHAVQHPGDVSNQGGLALLSYCDVIYRPW